MVGTVLSIERCSLHDGPGLRTTVFLKGCPLSCLWCHNPESHSFKPELYYFDEKCSGCGGCVAVCRNQGLVDGVRTVNHRACSACGQCVSACPRSAFEIKGRQMSAQDVMDEVLKDVRFYEQSGGGLTVSGGEPFSQFEFTLELLRLAKENGIHTCLETSGYALTDSMLAVAPYVDLFLFDFKESDEENHQKFTGVSCGLIMDNLQALHRAGAKVILRCPIIPACNARDGHFDAIAATANALGNIIEINLMPYHPMGASKAARIGREYPLDDMDFPTDAQVEAWVQRVGGQTSVPVRQG
jgi:pyruvate formate lyase activating enzyme